MKTVNTIYLFAIILLSACVRTDQVITTQEPPTLPGVTVTEILPSTTPTPQPTATKTPVTPTITKTATLTPTLALPVSLDTPVPISKVRINAENVSELKEVARYYGEVELRARLTSDRKFVFILDPEGITKYAYDGMELISRVELVNSATNLQMSDDGSVMLIDGWWLDWRNGNEPKPTLLSDLLDIEPHSTTLSPDGSMIAAQKLYCEDVCDHVLWIVSTKDFSVLYKETGHSAQENPTFSPDGAYLALDDIFITAYPSGKTERSGALVRVWRISDFTIVSTIKLKYPFEVTDMAFAPDNVTLAIANYESIDIFNGISNENLTTIAGLCGDIYHPRQIMFAQLSR